MSRRAAALAVLVAGVSLLAPTRAGAQGTADEGAPAPRLLVYSVPGLTWADVRAHDLPAIDAFVEEAAIADLAPRSVTARSTPGDAYLTISGGSRATSDPAIDGQVLAVDEKSVGSAAGEIYQRRTGDEPDGPFVSITWPSLQRLNDAEPYDTEIGSLAEVLTDGGVRTAAIGNADGIDGVGDSYERQAGLALADPTGVVLDGNLGKDLLEPDPSQAYGVRLAPDRVVEAFEQAWTPDGAQDQSATVLVEASDLARTLRYRPTVEAERYRAMWAESLRHSDAIFAELLESVDPERDTVLLVAPYNGRGDRDLTVVGLRGPGIDAGGLRSASTQRAGFLTLVDLAPTILDVFDLARPTQMEGRPAEVTASDRSGAARVDRLIDLNEAARFREQLLVPTTTAIVLGFALVAALAIAAHANRWSGRARSAIALSGLVVLAAFPASYLARLFALEARGIGFYWAVLALGAVAIGGGSWVLARRFGTPRGALIGVLAVVALVLVGDVVSGSRLSLSAAFGYSATGNSRLYGISNYSFGQLAAAACIVSAWLVDVRPGRAGRGLGVGAMAATLVVLGMPMWGSDVGGVLAFTPAVATFAVIVTGRSLRWRTLAVGAAATGLAIVAFGVIDLSRAPSQRGHLGRLFERVGDEGLGPLIAMVERKLAANLAVSTSSLWVLALPLAAGFWAFYTRFPDRPNRQVAARFPTLRAGLAATAVAGVLGSLLNDSGAIVGGVTAVVATTSVAVLLVLGEAPDAAATTSDADDATSSDRGDVATVRATAADPG